MNERIIFKSFNKDKYSIRIHLFLFSNNKIVGEESEMISCSIISSNCSIYELLSLLIWWLCQNGVECVSNHMFDLIFVFKNNFLTTTTTTKDLSRLILSISAYKSSRTIDSEPFFGKYIVFSWYLNIFIEVKNIIGKINLVWSQ